MACPATDRLASAPVSAVACSWCGEAVDGGYGFRAWEPVGERQAAFCRLEHVVPWVIQGAHWSTGEAPAGIDAPGACAHCAGPLGDRRVLVVRHRGEYRIADAFCELEHLLAWAKAGGRWQT